MCGVGGERQISPNKLRYLVTEPNTEKERMKRDNLVTNHPGRSQSRQFEFESAMKYC